MPALPILATAIVCSVVSVHDGGSLRCDGEKVRIANIDAPELAGPFVTYRQFEARIIQKRKRVLEDGPIVEGVRK